MDLSVSYNWIKEYLKSSKPVEEFAADFSLKSQTIDRITRVEPKFKGVIIAKITDIQPHPNADRLRLATVDSGAGTQQVVCGAPNIEVGQVIPLAPVGATVQSPKDGESFKIAAAKIRDVESNGMLCSQVELSLGEDHEGIMILPSDTKIGKPLEEILDLDDYILDIEVTSNRPDAMSVVGLAREAGAVLGSKTNIKPLTLKVDKAEEVKLSVEVKDSKLCPRYQAVVMTDFKVGPSPLWMQMRLMSAGLRPINNLVDITNYVAFEYGQPMHVFDYDKLQGQKIVVRKAKKGETIKALDDNTYKLDSDNLVIADGKTPIAVAGVMGGMDSAAIEGTKTLVFESANFDPVSVRRTSRGLNLYSDSSSKFEKGLHPESASVAMLRAIELAKQIAGAKIASPVIDIYDAKSYKTNPVKLSINNVTRYLGVEVPVKQIKSILESLGFGVSGANTLKITIPWWRANDVREEHDLIEEIARMYGYDNLPAILPDGMLPKQDRSNVLVWEKKTKEILAGMGFSEIYNYSFVSQEIMERVGFSVKKAIKIDNELNEEMEYMRTSLVPQILENVSHNLKNFSEFKIFELSNIYRPNNNDELPSELPMLSGAVVGNGVQSFLKAKGSIELLLKKLGITDYQLLPPDIQSLMWEKDHYLNIFQGKTFLGEFGIINSDILEKFDIDEPVTLFDIDFTAIAKNASTSKTYTAVPEFPAIVRDISVVVDRDLLYAQLISVIKDDLIQSVEYKDVFVKDSLGENKKSVLLSIEFRSAERTLQSLEVDEIMKRVVEELAQKFQATLR